MARGDLGGGAAGERLMRSLMRFFREPRAQKPNRLRSWRRMVYAACVFALSGSALVLLAIVRSEGRPMAWSWRRGIAEGMAERERRIFSLGMALFCVACGFLGWGLASR
jgi:hypothetical protein